MQLSTISAIKKFALERARSGRLFDPQNPAQWDTFFGSCDRFAEIAHAFQDCHRILDVGSGGGLLISLLVETGHECHAADITDAPAAYPDVYQRKKIPFSKCNIEVDRLPFADGFFDAVSCCQCLEHFTHSHLPAMLEFHRVLRPCGVLEIDVPNVASFRNRSRLLRGKNITWDYEKCYLDQAPILYQGIHFYPDRHNREFTKAELELLFKRGGFRNIRSAYLRSRRLRFGWKRLASLGTCLRDLIPSLRKSIICYGAK